MTGSIQRTQLGRHSTSGPFCSSAPRSSRPTRQTLRPLARLLAVYEPGATYTPIKDGDFYGPRLRRLATVQLTIVRTQAKFKVGPAGPDQAKRHVVQRLRERGEPNDARAADVIESYLR